jgi:hypothetical protein
MPLVPISYAQVCTIQNKVTYFRSAKDHAWRVGIHISLITSGIPISGSLDWHTIINKGFRVPVSKETSPCRSPSVNFEDVIGASYWRNPGALCNEKSPDKVNPSSTAARGGRGSSRWNCCRKKLRSGSLQRGAAARRDESVCPLTVSR